MQILLSPVNVVAIPGLEGKLWVVVGLNVEGRVLVVAGLWWNVEGRVLEGTQNVVVRLVQQEGVATRGRVFRLVGRGCVDMRALIWTGLFHQRLESRGDSFLISLLRQELLCM